jgi:hypothetical protein
VSALDGQRSVAILDEGSELPFELFLGVPRHRAPDVVIASGMTEYIDFLSGPSHTGSFNAPSAALLAEKEHFGSNRRTRWFGL